MTKGAGKRKIPPATRTQEKLLQRDEEDAGRSCASRRVEQEGVGECGRTRGVPDGYTKETIAPIRQKAREEAEIIVSKIAPDEDEFATEALKTAVEVMRVPGETRERLAAARLVLDFTKTKPSRQTRSEHQQSRRLLEFTIGRREQMKKKHLEIRKRLYNEFDFYSKSALKIRTKKGEIAPLALNPAQQILHEAVQQQMRDDGKIRVIILKARQQGLSTYSGGYLYFSVSQQKARKAMVITSPRRQYSKHCSI